MQAFGSQLLLLLLQCILYYAFRIIQKYTRIYASRKNFQWNTNWQGYLQYIYEILKFNKREIVFYAIKMHAIGMSRDIWKKS